MPLDDATLVHDARAGDQRAVAELYDRYSDRLYDYARRLTNNPADAADIVQDTFVTAIKRLDQLRDPSLVRAWLYAITRSEVHRRHRRVNRLQYGSFDNGAEPVVHGGAVDTVNDSRALDIVHQAEIRALLTSAAGGLNDDDREVLDLYLRHDLSGRELAAALNIPERHVAVTVQRVRDRLARAVGVVLLTGGGCTQFQSIRAALAAGPDGSDASLTPIARKRLARHVDGCVTCTRQQHERMRPEVLLGATPLLAAPAALRSATLLKMRGTSPVDPTSTDPTSTDPTSTTSAADPASSTATPSGTASAADPASSTAAPTGTAAHLVGEGRRVWLHNGFPVVRSGLTRVTGVTGMARLATVALLTAGGASVIGIVAWQRADDGDRARQRGEAASNQGGDGTNTPTLSEPPVASTPSVDPDTSGSVTVVASTDVPTPAPSTTQTSATTAPSTAPATSPIAVPTTPASPTSPPTTTPAPPTTSPDVTAPSIGAPSSNRVKISSAHPLGGGTCTDDITATVSVTVTDDRAVTAVEMSYTHENGAPRVVSMTRNGNVWTATVGPIPAAEIPVGPTFPISATITAVDAAGNSSSRPTASVLKIDGCPIVT